VARGALVFFGKKLWPKIEKEDDEPSSDGLPPEPSPPLPPDQADRDDADMPPRIGDAP
jgi:hypothetical protein